MASVLRPDDEDKPFIRRWNLLARILLLDTSVKLVMRTAMDYADFGDGSSCRPSNDRICRETGYGDKAVRMAWSVMRGLGLAVRVREGVSYKGIADEYELQIPADWAGIPALGPSRQRFTCVGCTAEFNPSGNSLLGANDSVTFDLRPMSFCSAPPLVRPGAKRTFPPKPRKPTCFDKWDHARHLAGEKRWVEAKEERWGWFHQARGEMW